VSGARAGWVYLVGAGPGDPGLITRRGLDLLRSCDVVLYDRLTSPALVEEAPDGAERVYVGKDPEGRIRPQGEIDALTVAAARADKRVVRLKGGDPYVFGRGADEAQALAAAGIPFEVVPGVSSAVAVPSYAGVPLTHGGIASSFAVLTAHETGARTGRDERFAKVASSVDTVVILMGARTLRDSLDRLIAAGRAPDEPAAMIQWGSTARQRTAVATLETLADVVERERIGPPSIVVIGEVVKMRDALAWFEKRPLFGRRIVVTRAPHQAAGLADRLLDLGADVMFCPVIRIIDPASWEPLDTAIKKLAEGLYAWVVFPSVNSVERFFARMRMLGTDARAFGRTKVAAVGPTTASLLRDNGIAPDLVPETFTGDVIAESLGRGSSPVLIPRVAGAPRDLLRILERSGWLPDEVETYRNVRLRPPDSEGEQVKAGKFDAVTFTSASTVRHFAEVVAPPADLGLAEGGEATRLVACIGPKTADQARSLGFRVDVVAEEHTAQGLVEALMEKLGRGRPTLP
jgi:uroporphyrinogen III methyltransferase/synthase